jgi:hypothetical protein
MKIYNKLHTELPHYSKGDYPKGTYTSMINKEIPKMNDKYCHTCYEKIKIEKWIEHESKTDGIYKYQ